MPASSDSAGRPLRLGFAGTPAFAASVLEGLLGAGHRPQTVYTQPDRPVGRGRRMQPSPVKLLAARHDLPVQQPETLKGAEHAAALTALDLDVLVVAAYGLILPPAVLAAPRQGCLNVHASLLPRWRGAAPVERAIMAGDRETGISIMQMERGLDTGPVYLRRRCAIEPDTDGPTLEARLARLGAEALIDCLTRLDELLPEPQPEHGVTYAHKLSADDARIDWTAPAARIGRQVRALCGRLAAFTFAGGTRIAVLEARAEPADGPGRPGQIGAAGRDGIRVTCGSGVLVIARLKLSVGKGAALTAADAVNGYRRLFGAGQVLGDVRVEDSGPPSAPKSGP